MKLTTCFGILAALGICGSTYADLLYTFSTDNEGFANVDWVSPGPAGWPDGAVIKQNKASGGWTLGDGGGPKKEFPWAPGGGVDVQQTAMQALANAGNSRVSFDLFVDGTSFPVQAGTWWQLHFAANSDGSAGWSQRQLVDAWHDTGDATRLTYHYDYAFSELNWQPSDTWFQLFFGSNSDGDKPIGFYIDNLKLYAVPEPGTFALAGLGATALLIFRRRD